MFKKHIQLKIEKAYPFMLSYRVLMYWKSSPPPPPTLLKKQETKVISELIEYFFDL